MTQATRRPREESNNPVIVVDTPDERATSSKANNISYNTHQKEKVAFKLFKPQRYESHYAFITCRQKKKIIPDGLKVYLQPSTSNHREEFSFNWHERLQSFSLTLISTRGGQGHNSAIGIDRGNTNWLLK